VTSKPSLNPTQLSSLSLQAGAFSGAAAAGLSSSSVNAPALLVVASVAAGFIGGGAVGWVALRPAVSQIAGWPSSDRPKTLLVAGVASSLAAGAAILLVGALSSTQVQLPLPAIAALTVAVVVGLPGSGP
jgi:hypothetical protein